MPAAKKRPYIGITGIESGDQAESLIRTHEKFGETSHMLMIASLVSHKTILGTTQGSVNIPLSSVKSIYKSVVRNDSPDVMFALHYNVKSVNEIGPEIQGQQRAVIEKPLSEQIGILIGPLYNDFVNTEKAFQLGLQLNSAWPDPKEVEKIRKKYPKLRIILQVQDFTMIGSKIGRYEGLVDYVLLDLSRGRGLLLDPTDSVMVSRVVEQWTSTRIGFAGGLNDENVAHILEKLIADKKSHDFSIDAQNRLRTDERFDLKKATAYLRKAEEIFQQNN